VIISVFDLVKRGSQSQLIEFRRVKQAGHSPNLSQALVCQGDTFAQSGSRTRLKAISGLANHGKVHRESGHRLPSGVVETPVPADVVPRPLDSRDVPKGHGVLRRFVGEPACSRMCFTSDSGFPKARANSEPRRSST
jgi:hypothetical protein